MRIGITRELPGLDTGALAAEFDDVVGPFGRASLGTAELRHLASRVDVLLCTLTDVIDADLLRGAPDLKCVVTYSVGVDHIDVAAARTKGIRIAHTPDVLTDATADLTWALILACARRLKPGLRFVEEGFFRGFDPSLMLGLQLRGALLGIVGMGKIGTAVARRGIAFGMHVGYCGTPKEELPFEARHMSLEELLRRSDVVSLHCPLTDKTRHLIGRRELATMKSDAVFINTARGAVVEEEALVAHLRSHPDFHAGLDVFEEEPELKPGLAGLPNAICLPHIGSAARATREEMTRICVGEAVRFARGEPLRYEL